MKTKKILKNKVVTHIKDSKNIKKKSHPPPKKNTIQYVIDTKPTGKTDNRKFNRIKRHNHKRNAFFGEEKKLENDKKERNLTDILFGDTGQQGSDASSCLPEYIEENYTIDANDNFDNELELEIEETEDLRHNVETAPVRKAAWVDNEDQEVRVKDIKRFRSRRIRGSLDTLYKDTLKESFSQFSGGCPEWAKLDRSLDDDSEDESLRKKTSYLTEVHKPQKLPKYSINYKLVKNLNKNSDSEGFIIKSIDFKPDINLSLVASFSANNVGIVTLFKFDGKNNYKLKSVFFPNFPIRSAKFLHKTQQFVAVTNYHGRFYVYDIQEGKTIDVLWPTSSESNSVKALEVSPDGNYLAFVRGAGEISIYNSLTLAIIETVTVPANVSAIVFNPESTIMYAYGDTGSVYMFDLVAWQCVNCFYDDGCVSGTAIAMAPNGRLLACGSSSGVVNLYDTLSLLSSQSPKPLKAFGSLVTAVTSLAFNPTSEILAMASVLKDNAIKLVHTGSLTVFANFPLDFKLDRINSIAFSPDKKYISIGNNRRSAILIRLLHY